jgi:hypothetical protein
MLTFHEAALMILAALSWAILQRSRLGYCIEIYSSNCGKIALDCLGLQSSDGDVQCVLECGKIAHGRDTTKRTKLGIFGFCLKSYGAGGRTRTDMSLTSPDFESAQRLNFQANSTISRIRSLLKPVSVGANVEFHNRTRRNGNEIKNRIRL